MTVSSIIYCVSYLKGYSMTIKIVVDIEVVAGQLDVALGALTDLARETVKEEGNLQLEVYVDESVDNSIVLIEEWKDQEVIDSHAKLAHTNTYIERVHKVFASAPRVRKLRLISPLDA